MEIKGLIWHRTSIIESRKMNHPRKFRRRFSDQQITYNLFTSTMFKVSRSGSLTSQVEVSQDSVSDIFLSKDYYSWTFQWCTTNLTESEKLFIRYVYYPNIGVIKCRRVKNSTSIIQSEKTILVCTVPLKTWFHFALLGLTPSYTFLQRGKDVHSF